MSGAIGPGDWVELIGPAGKVSPVCPEFVAGGLYCVEAFQYGYGCGRDPTHDHPGLHFVGKPRDKAGWPMCQFKPIYRPKQEIIEALKAPPKRAPKRQREDA